MTANVVVQSVYQLLSRHSIQLATQFMLEFQLEPECSTERAIVLVNRHWRDVLAKRPYSTMEVRTYLVDDCPLLEWVSLFERGVLPELLRS